MIEKPSNVAGFENPASLKARIIKIKKFNKPVPGAVLTEQKSYSIFLGSDYIVYTESLKDAKRFLAETNRLLNQYSKRCRSIANEIYTIYHALWPYMRSDATKKILDHLFEFNRVMFLAVDRSGHPNGNYFVFTHMKNACAELHQIVVQLMRFTRKGDTINQSLGEMELHLDQVRLFLSFFPAMPFDQLLSPFLSTRIRVVRNNQKAGIDTDIRG